MDWLLEMCWIPQNIKNMFTFKAISLSQITNPWVPFAVWDQTPGQNSQKQPWTEPGVKAGPQIPYWKGTSNPPKLSALKELQRDEGKVRVPPPQVSGLLHCSQGVLLYQLCRNIGRSGKVHLVGGNSAVPCR